MHCPNPTGYMLVTYGRLVRFRAVHKNTLLTLASAHSAQVGMKRAQVVKVGLDRRRWTIEAAVEPSLVMQWERLWP